MLRVNTNLVLSQDKLAAEHTEFGVPQVSDK
jgi:hypothetical protein